MYDSIKIKATTKDIKELRKKLREKASDYIQFISDKENNLLILLIAQSEYYKGNHIVSFYGFRFDTESISEDFYIDGSHSDNIKTFFLYFDKEKDFTIELYYKSNCDLYSERNLLNQTVKFKQHNLAVSESKVFDNTETSKKYVAMIRVGKIDYNRNYDRQIQFID